ncbi:hypothetical protein FRC09_015892 [Ceratobasidium sp. 395]|nr:hypothetical protein FRC09_015892 [Ceratobasidium sp. 395]
MSLSLEEAAYMSLKVESIVQCSDLPETPAFRTTFHRTTNYPFMEDTVREYLDFQIKSSLLGNRVLPLHSGPANDSSPLNVLGALDALGADMIQSLWGRFVYLNNRNDSSQLTIKPALTTIEWEPREGCETNNGLCNLDITDVNRMFSSRTYAEDSMQSWDGIYYEALNVTMVNILIAVRDAIHFELKHNTTANIFTSKDYFASRIHNDDQATSMRRDLEVNTGRKLDIYTWSWGCVQSPNSWAGSLTAMNGLVNNLTIPIQASLDEQSPSVFVTDYLCPVFQLKSTSDLIVSVFSGTFAMCATVYGIFLWFTAELDEKYEERAHLKDLEAIPLTTQHRDSSDGLADHGAETSGANSPGSPTRL